MKPINQSYDFQHNDVKNAIAVNMVVETRPFDPDIAYSGQIYYNSGMKLLRVYDGTTWKSLSASGGVMTYKGTVTNWSELPISGMQGGDYWVNSTLQTARVWNGDTNTWDDVGNSTFTVDSSMSETSQNALENRIVTQEMLQRMKKLPKETFSGLEYQFPFNINPLVQTPNSITTSFDTLVLNDGTTRGHFDMAIPSADPTNNRAGLYNKALADLKADVTEVDKKLDKLDNEPVSGQPYHFPFNINPLVQESNRISTSFDTITLDGNKTKINYQMSIPAADPSNDKAGLLTKALYDQKSKVTVSSTGTATDTVNFITIDGVEKKIGSSAVSYVQTSVGTDVIGTITIDDTATQIKGAKVEVSNTGTATDIVKYIKINDVEKKLPGTAVSYVQTSTGTETIGTITIDDEAKEIKGTKVEVTPTGTATDIVKYIKLNDVEKKIGSDVAYTQSSTGTEVIGSLTVDGTATEIKGTKVEVSETGTATSKVKYIKVNDVESKLGTDVSYSQTSTGTDEIGKITIDGTETVIKGTKVEVSDTGTATEVAKYIKVNDVEKKLASTEVEYEQTYTAGTEDLGQLTVNDDVYTIKGPKIELLDTGTSTSKIRYIKLNGVEKKIATTAVEYLQMSAGTEEIGTIEVDGMVTSIKGTQVGVSPTGTATDVVKYITINGVEKKIGGVDIVDNLTSTDIDKALSANQGKQLNDTKQSKITSGTADPSGGNDGDVYIKISA